MEKLPITKEQAIKALLEIVAQKDAVRSYLRGEISLQTLSEKGIKLATPL